MLKRGEWGLVATASALVFSRVFGLSLVLPNFRDHYAGAFGASTVLIGLAFGAYGLTMALMQLPAGVVSDRLGRRPVLLASTLVFILGSVMAAQASSMGWLIAARLLQGLGAVGSVAMAAVGETIPAQRRTFAMALVGIPAGAGFLVGIAAGPMLYPFIGMGGLFLVTAGVAALPVLALPWVRIAPAHARPPVPPGREGAILGLAFSGFVANYALTTTLFFLPTTDWRTLLPMLAAALLLVGGISRAVDRLEAARAPIVVGLVGVSIAATLFVLAGGVLALVFGGVFFTAHATLQSTLPSQVSRVAGPAGGRGHGMQNVVAYLGTFAAGPVAGVLASQAGWAFALLGLLALLASGAVLRLVPQR